MIDFEETNRIHSTAGKVSSNY